GPSGTRRNATPLCTSRNGIPRSPSGTKPSATNSMTRRNTTMAKHALTTSTIHTADVVALATVQHVEHVLLVRRAHAPYAGYWALPGGHVDPGETPVEAAVRELDEETGLQLAPGVLSFVGVYDTPGRDPRGTYASSAYAVRLH